MKILSLRLANLNSLQGEWSIDFTNPEYTSHGIFSITGPTGSGKSTILDAIGLALYGATPRLAKISKSSNEIMSRHSGQCFAEVVFATESGQFRCHWNQHRAKKKAGGELQAPSHEIAEADGLCRVIEHQTRRVTEYIERITGMDFQRFTRSVMLAQGAFDSFLRANIEEKSRILEQITGTDIYSQISQKIFLRHKQEKQQLQILQQQVEGIELLPPETLQQLQKEREDSRQGINTCTTALEKIQQQLNTQRGVTELQKQLSQLRQQQQDVQLECNQFAPQKLQLQQAQKAAVLEADYAQITQLRKQQGEDEKLLEQYTEQQANKKQQAQQAQQQAGQAEKQKQDIQKQQHGIAPILREVRRLDQELDHIGERGQSAKGEYQKNQKEHEASSNKLQRNTQDYNQAQESLQRLQQYQQQHSRDEILVTNLTAISHQWQTVQEMDVDALQMQKRKESIHKEIEELQKTDSQHQEKIDSLSQQEKTNSEQLVLATQDLQKLFGNTSLRELHQEKEHLLRQLALEQKISSLEEERTKLQHGEACPLCGSKEHPYGQSTPVQDATSERIDALSDLIHRVERQEKTVDTIEQQHRNIVEQQQKSNNEKKHIENQSKQIHKQLVASEQQTNELNTRHKNAKDGLLQILQPLGIDGLTDQLLASLRDRLDRWNQHVENKQQLQQQSQRLLDQQENLEQRVKELKVRCQEQRALVQDIALQYTERKKKRQEIFAEKQPDEEERRLSNAVEKSEKIWQKAQQVLITSNTARDELVSRITTMNQAMAQRIKELDQALTQFANNLQSQGFANETEFLHVCMTGDEREAITKKQQSLAQQQVHINAQLQDHETRLQEALCQLQQETTVDCLLAQQQDNQQQLKHHHQTQADITSRLQANERDGEKLRQQQSKIHAQERGCRRWQKLDYLIGSADGKKYRTFAQGLTFEQVVALANNQLMKMSDRYLLARSTKEPLELLVIDNYQAGEQRSTRNLSGGESFILSLALALGLSAMSSDKVRVDSLFLDEGFATLDEDALEVALDTLSSLQRDGRLIGVISHLPALQQRISTSITVTPASGGTSRISGPGVGG